MLYLGGTFRPARLDSYKDVDERLNALSKELKRASASHGAGHPDPFPWTNIKKHPHEPNTK
eukprot:4583239-Amphidinium_carterae.1